MRCIRCGHDSNFKDRPGRTCPQCKGELAFEPKAGDPVTDTLFLNAIKAVSGEGRIRWGVEHLYYEVCRRKASGLLRGRAASPVVTIAGFVLGALLVFSCFRFFGEGRAETGGVVLLRIVLALGAPVGILLMLTIGWHWYDRFRTPFVRVDPDTFDSLWNRWCRIHGTPAGVIVRQPSTVALGKPGAAPALEPDIGDYSFDRAVICDRARTVDLLVANNFHFENNCAVLSIDGYPPGPFATVKAMLRRNPRLLVVTLHDATPDGCRLATRVATDADWFGGKLKIIDLGLRPGHAAPFRGFLLQRWSDVASGGGITWREARWFAHRELELAAVRPEQVLKRLFRGLQAHENDDRSGGGVTTCSAFESGSGDGSDGHGLLDGGADSFG